MSRTNYRIDVHQRIVARLQQRSEPQRIRTLCAWCGVLIHDGVLFRGHESHGICKSCDVKLRAEAGL